MQKRKKLISLLVHNDPLVQQNSVFECKKVYIKYKQIMKTSKLGFVRNIMFMSQVGNLLIYINVFMKISHDILFLKGEKIL